MIDLKLGDLGKLALLGIIGLILLDAFLDRMSEQFSKKRTVVFHNLTDKDIDQITKNLKKE